MAIKHKRRDQQGKDQRKKPDEAAKLNALPATFKFAAKTLQIMSEKGGSAGSIVTSRFKSYNYKLIYALVMNTLKNIKIIKKIIHETKLMKKVPENDPFMLEILVGDLLYGKGLKSVEQNSTAVSVMSQKESIVKQQNLLKKNYPNETSDVDEVKYLRINLLKSNLEHVTSQLNTVGLKQLEYSKDKIKFKKFINKFKSMQPTEYMFDFHFPNDLIVLKRDAIAKINKTDLIKKGKCLLQDKASFMAVEAMDVQPGQKIIDACCAPGGKTILIASKMKNKGKIMAYDVDKKRLLSAIHLLKMNGVTCAKTEVLDFSKVKLKRLPKSLKIDKFDCILIDPSCSGSGIRTRTDYKATGEEKGRLKKLQAFQVSLLRHALRADVSKRIVYCTCSNSVEENEQVVEMALNESGAKELWNVVDVLPYWQHRGESNYEFGSKCLRSDSSDLTNGFFIARLERNDKEGIQGGEEVDDEDENTVQNEEKDTRKKPSKQQKLSLKKPQPEVDDEEELLSDQEMRQEDDDDEEDDDDDDEEEYDDEDEEESNEEEMSEDSES